MRNLASNPTLESRRWALTKWLRLHPQNGGDGTGWQWAVMRCREDPERWLVLSRDPRGGALRPFLVFLTVTVKVLRAPVCQEAQKGRW